MFIKRSHSCQPRWLPVHLDILVQEGNYLSQSRHVWQGDTFKMSAHMSKVAVSAEWHHPQIFSRGNSTLAIRGIKQNSHVPPIGSGSWANSPLGFSGAKTLFKRTQKGGVLHSQGITEAGSRPLLRQLSTYQSAAPCHTDLLWHQLPEALPCLTEDFFYLTAHLAPEILPCKTLTTPLPTVLSPGPTA